MCYLDNKSYHGVDGEKPLKTLPTQVLDDLILLGRGQIPSNWNVMETTILAKVAQDWFWGLNQVNQHLLKAITPQGVKGDVRLVGA